MNSKSSNISNPHRLLGSLSDKINFKKSNMLLYQISTYAIHINI